MSEKLVTALLTVIPIGSIKLEFVCFSKSSISSPMIREGDSFLHESIDTLIFYNETCLTLENLTLKPS